MKMKILLISIVIFPLLAACSDFKEDLETTGDAAVQEGTQNAAETARQAPADISNALSKLEDDIRN
jgi:hypothetical protein